MNTATLPAGDIFTDGNIILFGTPGQMALAALERVPSPDPIGRGAPRYVPTRRRKISHKLTRVTQPTGLLTRKLAALLASI